jgi:hypothetical protein
MKRRRLREGGYDWDRRGALDVPAVSRQLERTLASHEAVVVVIGIQWLPPSPGTSSRYRCSWAERRCPKQTNCRPTCRCCSCVTPSRSLMSRSDQRPRIVAGSRSNHRGPLGRDVNRVQPQPRRVMRAEFVIAPSPALRGTPSPVVRCRLESPEPPRSVAPWDQARASRRGPRPGARGTGRRTPW